jgi:hypothetical protein
VRWSSWCSKESVHIRELPHRHCAAFDAVDHRAVGEHARVVVIDSPDGREAQAHLPLRLPCDVSIFRHNGLAAGRHSNRFPSSLPDRSGL